MHVNMAQAPVLEQGITSHHALFGPSPCTASDKTLTRMRGICSVQLFSGRMVAMRSEFMSGGEEAIEAYVQARSNVSACSPLSPLCHVTGSLTSLHAMWCWAVSAGRGVTVLPRLQAGACAVARAVGRGVHCCMGCRQGRALLHGLQAGACAVARAVGRGVHCCMGCRQGRALLHRPTPYCGTSVSLIARNKPGGASSRPNHSTNKLDKRAVL